MSEPETGRVASQPGSQGSAPQPPAASSPVGADPSRDVNPLTADGLAAIIRDWLNADDATHWGDFELTLDAAVEGMSERSAIVAMLRSDARVMRANAIAYFEEAPTDARALQEVASTLMFKAAQIERGDHWSADMSAAPCDSDRNPEGEDLKGLRAEHESAGPEGIAQ